MSARGIVAVVVGLAALLWYTGAFEDRPGLLADASSGGEIYGDTIEFSDGSVFRVRVDELDGDALEELRACKNGARLTVSGKVSDLSLFHEMSFEDGGDAYELTVFVAPGGCTEDE